MERSLKLFGFGGETTDRDEGDHIWGSICQRWWEETRDLFEMDMGFEEM